jgi:hypothetical protein
MPDRIAKRSRPIGSTPKRSRPPKTESTPNSNPLSETTPDTSNALTDTSEQTSTSLALPTQTASKAVESYTGLTQVPHNLTFPTFDPNTYFAGDLFTSSSALQETEKDKADEAVESIEKKRHTLRIVGANIALNTDIVRTANDFRKFEGTVIDYATTGVNNEIKFVNYQTAGVNKDIALNRFDQSQERLIQGQSTLTGMRSITPLITDEWVARKSLKSSQIKSLELAATQAKEALEPRLMQLSQDFKQEMNDLN